MPNSYQGKCHCGAIAFSFESEAIQSGIRCNCSLCRRKGAMMTSQAIPPDQFHFDADNPQLGLYQFGAETARHYFCKNCGIYTFHVTARQPNHFRANLGCIDNVDPFALEAEVFNGKELL